jgi:hypothetical protein
MNIPPVEPAESIPTEQDALVAYLVNFYRHSVTAARRAVEAPADSKSD